MHTADSYSASVPGFLIKLWKLVEDTSYNDFISWSESGTSFIIKDQTTFSKELLPLYFKHSNMASFIRQLNMYGFRKVTNFEKGGLKTDSDEMEFHHLFFVRGQASLLELIKRKMPPAKGNGNEIEPSSSNAKELLSDLTSIRQKQEKMDSMLLSMKKENEVLWKELSLLRKKHKTQEQIIQKVIHFLVSLVRSNQGLAPKKKLPLLLHHDSGVAKGKATKLPQKLSLVRSDKSPIGFSILAEQTAESPQGPVIHEVTDFDVDCEGRLCHLADENYDDMLMRDDYPIVSNTSPAESHTPSDPIQPGVSPVTVEVFSSPMPSIASSIDPGEEPPEPELPTVLATEILSPSEPVTSQKPVLLSLTIDRNVGIEDGDLHTPAPVLMTPDILLTPGPFIIEHSADKPVRITAKTDASAPDVAGPSKAQQASDIDEIIQSANDSLFEGSMKDVLLSDNNLDYEIINDQENNFNNLQIAVSDLNPSTSGSFSKNLFSSHVINIEEDLDWLQDQLRAGNLNIDSSTLLGVCQRWEACNSLDSQLFSTDDIMNNTLLASQFANDVLDSKEPGNDITGNEIVQFAPSAFDTELNSVEGPLFEYLNDDDMPQSLGISEWSSEAETNPKSESWESGLADDCIKVSSDSLLIREVGDPMPLRSQPPTKKRKHSRRMK